MGRAKGGLSTVIAAPVRYNAGHSLDGFTPGIAGNNWQFSPGDSTVTRNDDGSYTEVSLDGQKQCIYFFEDGIPELGLHREGGPARISTETEGGIRVAHNESYYSHGVLTQEEDYSDVGWPVTTTTFFKDGQKHRDGDLPARVTQNSNCRGEITEEWWFEGKPHRDDGPAEITTYPASEGRPARKEERWEFMGTIVSANATKRAWQIRRLRQQIVAGS